MKGDTLRQARTIWVLGGRHRSVELLSASGSFGTSRMLASGLDCRTVTIGRRHQASRFDTVRTGVLDGSTGLEFLKISDKYIKTFLIRL